MFFICCTWFGCLDSSRLFHRQGDSWTAVSNPGGHQLGRRADAEGEHGVTVGLKRIWYC